MRLQGAPADPVLLRLAFIQIPISQICLLMHRWMGPHRKHQHTRRTAWSNTIRSHVTAHIWDHLVKGESVAAQHLISPSNNLQTNLFYNVLFARCITERFLRDVSDPTEQCWVFFCGSSLPNCKTAGLVCPPGTPLGHLSVQTFERCAPNVGFLFFCLRCLSWVHRNTDTLTDIWLLFSIAMWEIEKKQTPTLIPASVGVLATTVHHNVHSYSDSCYLTISIKAVSVCDDIFGAKQAPPSDCGVFFVNISGCRMNYFDLHSCLRLFDGCDSSRY